jgi:hypothetical protein
VAVELAFLGAAMTLTILDPRTGKRVTITVGGTRR